MDHTTMLTDILKLHCAGLHRARIKCLASLIVALFKVKTVNLTQIAPAFPGRAEIDAHYRRLQRFFPHVEIKPALVAHMVVSFLPYTTYTLALDRTTWTLGCFPINFLVVFDSVFGLNERGRTITVAFPRLLFHGYAYLAVTLNRSITRENAPLTRRYSRRYAGYSCAQGRVE